MDTLKTFVVSTPIDARDAVGWVLRVSGALSVMHRALEAHGRLSAAAIVAEEPVCEARGWLTVPNELADAPSHHGPLRLAGGPAGLEDDVWALGVLLYQLLTATLPFAGTTSREILGRIRAGPPPPLAVFDAGDDELQLVLDRLFAPRQAERLTKIHQLRGALLGWGPELASLPPLAIASRHEMIGDDDSAPSHGGDFDDEDAAPTAVWNVHDDPEIAATLARLREQATPDRARPGDGPLASAPEIDARSLDVLVDSSEGLALLDTSDGGARLSDMQALAARSAVASDEAPPPPSDETQGARKMPAAVAATAETAETAETAAPAETAESSRRTQWLVAVVVAFCVVAGGVAAVMTLDLPFGNGEPSAEIPPQDAVQGDSASPPPALATATAAASPTPDPKPAPEPIHEPAPKTAESATPAPPAACLASLFPEDTFSGKATSLDFVCGVDDPVRGASDVRTRVVLAGRGRGVTPGMREWSALGWYGMAAFAVARGRCCPNAGPLVVPATRGSCDVDGRLIALAGSISRGDEATAEQALGEYRQAIDCVFRGGDAMLYGQSSPPSAGELAVFRRFLRRTLALAAGRD